MKVRITEYGQREIGKEKSGSSCLTEALIHKENQVVESYQQIENIQQKWYLRNYPMMKGKLQEVVRCLRRHGGFVNESCGQHVHVDAANHTPQSLKNALTIMYAKEDILFKALKVQERREYSYCQKVRPEVLEKIRKIPNKSITMDRVRNVWYGGRDGSHTHYDHTRYYALNLHAVFSKGTLEWRCFESTLHAGKVRANITLALAISAQAINQRSTQMKKTPISENPAFTFRTFLLRLGLIGEEYKNVRKHLLVNLEGDLAWRYDKSTYECLKKKQRTEDVRSR